MSTVKIITLLLKITRMLRDRSVPNLRDLDVERVPQTDVEKRDLFLSSYTDARTLRISVFSWLPKRIWPKKSNSLCEAFQLIRFLVKLKQQLIMEGFSWRELHFSADSDHLSNADSGKPWSTVLSSLRWKQVSGKFALHYCCSSSCNE